MKILLTGGSGYIGSTLLARLIADGHQITAITRTQQSSMKVQNAGATGLIGDLYDSGWLAAELSTHDAAVHAASPGDESSPAMDSAVIDAAIAGLGGTSKPFVHTGGIWSYGTNPRISEVSDRNAPPLSAWRADLEARLLGSDVRATVVEPAVVYGHGGGLATLIAQGPRTDDGALRLIGGGGQHWTTVHVDDLADLYIRVLEAARAAERYIAASGDNPTVRELGEAVTGLTVSDTENQTRERLGADFADALLLDQQATGEKARRELGWVPSRPSLIDQLREGYADSQ